MQKKLTAPRIFTGVLLLFLITIAVCALVIPSLGFFQAIFRATGFNSAKVELIFDRLTVTDELAALGYDSGKEWGSEANPYVISQKYHVQNLSVLQNNGFFKEKKDANNEPLQSYFLVCDKDGKPVAIDCEGMKLAPVGTHANPFTGVIKGAPLAGEVRMYDDDDNAENGGGYGTAVSAIANLTVSASVSEPDIGFFGCIGYHGTATTDSATGNPIITGGYAANISNLLFADVTIESKVSWTDTLAKWWENFGEHKRTDDQEETHHIGIVAGHAEFATVEDISVFYSSDAIKTFDLASTSTTNYYSITGLVGMLEHVNPAAKDGNLIGGAGNSVSDGDMLIEGGFGGGGAVSGSLTGYMMAETLYNEHESVLKEQDTDHSNGITGVSADGIYDVKAMLKHGENNSYVSLFETVVMKETLNSGGFLGSGSSDPIDTSYYVFKDTVFTFAMSASSRNPGHVDYVQKVWVNPDSASISATNDDDNFELKVDNDTKRKGVSYKFSAVTTDTDWDENGYYILSYHDVGGEGWEDDKFFVFPINAQIPNGNNCVIVNASDFCDQYGEPLTTQPQMNGTNITEFYLTSTNTSSYEYAYKYTASKTFVDPVSTNALCAFAEASGSILGGPTGYKAAVPQFSGASSTALAKRDYTWNFDINNGKFAIYNQYAFSESWGIITTAGLLTLNFNLQSAVLSFSHKAETYGEQTLPDTTALANYYLFSIYKVDVAEELEPKNLFVTGTPTYEFNPSEYVLENDGNGGYTLAPIRSYNLNSGKGTYLSQLNHIVKLSKQTTANYQLKLSNNEILNWVFGDALDTNSGGVVNTQIGTTKQYITIPSGMISFYISEASPENPSYINIIVAVNPEQVSNGSVGFWKVNTGGTTFKFDISDPDDSFNLPISKSAANDSDKKYILPISNYKYPVLDDKGNPVIDEKTGQPKYQVLLDENGDPMTTYTYLGGEYALVYHSFEITQSGFYFLGSGNGPMSVAYFSVSGAAGTGADGSSASPLGNIDFVYANNNNIITVDKKFEGLQNVENEDHTLYYPSYHFVLMIPKNEQTGAITKVQTESIRIYRYLDPENSTSRTARHIKILGCNKAVAKGLAEMYQDQLQTE